MFAVGRWNGDEKAVDDVSSKKRPQSQVHEELESIKEKPTSLFSMRLTAETTRGSSEAKPKKIKKRRLPLESAFAATAAVQHESTKTGQTAPFVPVADDAKAWGIDPRLLRALEKNGIRHFFPIQRQVIPETLAQSRKPSVMCRDVCVGAATGSGKTLVFVVTVVQALLTRKIPRLRAVVLLPSRALATQVPSSNAYKKTLNPLMPLLSTFYI
jgi:ATP-dependent helicase YprA (DUF1998 family)